MNAHFKRHLVSNTVNPQNFTTVVEHATSVKNVFCKNRIGAAQVQIGLQIEPVWIVLGPDDRLLYQLSLLECVKIGSVLEP